MIKTRIGGGIEIGEIDENMIEMTEEAITILITVDLMKITIIGLILKT